MPPHFQGQERKFTDVIFGLIALPRSTNTELRDTFGNYSGVDFENMTTIETLAHEPLFVMKLDVAYDQAQAIGGEGNLGIYPVRGGTFEGDRLRGKVMGGGADWVTWRADGTMLIDVRTSLHTDDGALIAMHYQGYAAATSPEAAEKLRRREVVEYGDIYIRTTPRFVTQHPDYLWLNNVIALANGMRTDLGPIYHVFEIR